MLHMKNSDDRGHWPRQTEIHTGSAPLAINRPRMALANAPKMTPGRKWPIRCREATAAGSTQLRIDPAGAVTCTGRNEPSLCGTSGLTAALIANEAYARV